MLPDITITGLDTSAGGDRTIVSTTVDTSTEKITVVLETGEGLDYLVRWLADTDAVKLNARRVTALDELETRIESWTDTRAVEDIRFNCEACGSAERATSGFSDGCSQRCPPCWAAADLAGERINIELPTLKELAERLRLFVIEVATEGEPSAAAMRRGVNVARQVIREVRASGHMSIELLMALVAEQVQQELDETKARRKSQLLAICDRGLTDLTGEVPR